MPTQDRLTMSQVRTIRGDGKAEFVTHDAVIQPGRNSFASQDELKAYLVEMLGAKMQPGGIGGSVSRKGKYLRRSADGTLALTFGDPVLDTISSATGTLVIGGRTIDLTALQPGANTLGRTRVAGGGVVFAAPALKMMGIVHDAERWVLDDRLVCGISHRQRAPRFPCVETRLFGRRFGGLGYGCRNQRMEHRNQF